MSATTKIEDRKGEEIGDLRAWKKAASPGEGRWKKGRGPYELADSWLSGRGAGALRMALDGAEGTSGFQIEKGVADAQSRFDDFGGPLSHDLLLVGEAEGGRTIVAIQGKTGESFGQTLGEYKGAFTRKVARNENTNAPQRLRDLTLAVAGWEVADNASRLKLRFQLFSAVAGTLAAAVDEEADQAVLCIHELAHEDDKEHERNEDDLRDFLHTVFDAHVATDADTWVVGPLHATPRSDRIPSTIPLYIAKIST